VHFCDLICVTIINEKKETKYFKKTKQKNKTNRSKWKKNWLILWQLNILPWKYNTIFLVKKPKQPGLSLNQGELIAGNWKMGTRISAGGGQTIRALHSLNNIIFSVFPWHILRVTPENKIQKRPQNRRLRNPHNLPRFLSVRFVELRSSFKFRGYLENYCFLFCVPCSTTNRIESNRSEPSAQRNWANWPDLVRILPVFKGEWW